MTTLTTTPDAPLADSAQRFAASRLAGIGGLVFAGSVIVQNILRAGYPANDASASDVIDYYSDHRAISLVLAVLFAVGIGGLAAFVGGLVSRTARGRGRAPAIAGLLGAAGIVGNFTMLLAIDTSISGYIHRGAANADVVGGLWVLHASVFGVLLASIGVALAGFSVAAAATGVLTRRWRTVGLTGAVALLVAAATTPAIIDASPTMFLGLAGFLVWVAFIVRASVALMRTPEQA